MKAAAADDDDSFKLPKEDEAVDDSVNEREEFKLVADDETIAA